jgi:hypothetical protein
MVIEAVPEDLDLKISILGRLDRMRPKSTIIATNSASFRSGELVSEVRNRERVLNTLYYIPPRNRCVELMSCGYTSPDLVKFLKSEMEGIGLRPMSKTSPLPLPFFATLTSHSRRKRKHRLNLPPPLRSLKTRNIKNPLPKHRNTARNRHPLPRFLRCIKRTM